MISLYSLVHIDKNCTVIYFYELGPSKNEFGIEIAPSRHDFEILDVLDF